MKRSRSIAGALLFAVLFIAGIPSQAQTMPIPSAQLRDMGIYTVVTYKKDGGSSIKFTPLKPACIKAAEASKKEATVEKATPKLPTIDMKIKYQEKTVKQADKTYATAFWESITASGKLYYDATDAANAHLLEFNGNTTVDIQCGGAVFSTTLGDGDKTPWSKGEPLTTAFEKGKTIVKSQYWAGVTKNGPDGKVKFDTTFIVSWKPGKIQVKFILKGPRNLPFLTDWTDITSPVDTVTWGDGDITGWVTVNSFSITITQNGAGGTASTWSLTNETNDKGKIKRKAQAKKTPSGERALYPLVNWDAQIKKAEATKS